MIAALAASIFVKALTLALLHFLWQGVVIAAALAIVLALVDRAGAAVRYAICCAALALMAVAPIATSWVIFANMPRPSPGAAVAWSLAEAAAPAPIAGSAVALVALFLAWMIGALLMSARLVGGLVHLRGLVDRCSTPLTEAWQRRLARLGARLGLRRIPRLHGSARVDVPMAIGWIRPVILVPLAALTSLPASTLEAILAHELAHVRRHDYLVNALQSVVEVALFYHPCVHWVSRRIRVEREYCCDDVAVALLGDPLRYARALSDLEAARAATPRLALAATGGSLMDRIKRIVVNDSPAPASAGAALAPALLLLGTIGLGVIGASSCGSTDARAPGEQTKSAEAAQAAAKQSVDIAWLPPALSRYKPLFVSAAEHHGVDPDALAIMTLVESAGDAEAKSDSGALGLMQVMPATAARIATERGLADYAEAKLLDPAYNLDLGAFYLSRQIQAFGPQGDPDRAIELGAAAYNAGPQRVRAYLDGNGALPEETQRYKGLVVGMWTERRAPRSTTYDAWRGRVRARVATRSESPLPGARVTLPFGDQAQPFSGKPYFHEGLDLAGEMGAPVVAPLAGKVQSAGADGDKGNVVVIEHGGGIETQFHHLGDVSVKPGDTIARGAVIGTLGATGKVTGPHVHFEVRDNGEALDPAGYLGAAK